MTPLDPPLHILAVDCCEHVLAAFAQLETIQLEAVTARQPHLDQRVRNADGVDLLVLGEPLQPLSRGFIRHLRRLFPQLPLLVLHAGNEDQEQLHGEFLLSERAYRRDCAVVEQVRRLFPLASCAHLHGESDHQTVRAALQQIEQAYADPAFNLVQLARNLGVSARRLSRLLNQQTGATFRQLLNQVRLAVAQGLLRTRRFSVKEVAAQVGFTDSHYFSRSFKQLTGISPSDYGRRERELELH